jgi:allophanate hydrolase
MADTGFPNSMDIASLARAYAAGASPTTVVKQAYARIATCAGNPVWITLVPEAQALARASALEADPKARVLPLYGIPFAVKDNIDVAGLPTTAACREAEYHPATSATAVQRLLAAGAILIGKANLDQFATGLVGTRSPWGAVRNAFDPRFVSGGSSSGSAVAVAEGMVSFSLGTDTAGSGRVPAGFNNLVGLKPTRGSVSARGVVPACRSLDTVSVFALDVADTVAVLSVIEGSTDDAYGRPGRAPECAAPAAFRFGVPRREQLAFFGDTEYQRLFDVACERLAKLGGEPVAIDIAPLREAAELLYAGPWVAERAVAIEAYLPGRPELLHPVTRAVVDVARGKTASDAFRAQYRMAEIKAGFDPVMAGVDFLLVPTAPTIYSIEALEREPIQYNSHLGTYTNFVNLLDLAALAVPSGFRDDGLPFGVTLIGPAFSDRRLAAFGARLHAAAGLQLGKTGVPVPRASDTAASAGVAGAGEVALAVVGAHLSGQPLNHQLTSRNARLLRTCRSAAGYRLHALANTTPPKPGMTRAGAGESGSAIELEVWALTTEAFGSFVAEVPAPMSIGNVTLEDGSTVKGFSCEPHALAGARDITSFGGWRAYLASVKA